MIDGESSLPIPARRLAGAEDAEDARRLVARVPAGTNAIEYRMDLAERAIPPGALLALDPRPVIPTYRSLAEGGNFSGSAEEYARLVVECYEVGAAVDLEHGRGLLAGPRRLRRPGAHPVASRHSPFALPEDLKEDLRDEGRTPAQ